MDYVSGSPEQQTTGLLRPKFGQMYTDSNKMPHHTNGTAWIGTGKISGNQVAPPPVNLGALPGTSTIVLAGLANNGTILAGDLFTYGVNAATADNRPQRPQTSSMACLMSVPSAATVAGVVPATPTVW